MQDLIEGRPTDLNVDRLRKSYSPLDYETMLRLASEMISMRDEDLSAHPDPWSCLGAGDFVNTVAKTYWDIILDDRCRAARRLMAHLLRSVCGLIERESQA